jgi:hypothetical protein
MITKCYCGLGGFQQRKLRFVPFTGKWRTGGCDRAGGAAGGKNGYLDGHFASANTASYTIAAGTYGNVIGKGEQKGKLVSNANFKPPSRKKLIRTATERPLFAYQHQRR